MAEKHQVDICAEALTLLGEEPIDAFSDNGDPGVVAERLYEPTKNDLLSRHPWRFATKKGQLSRLVETPENEWRYQFQLPSDRLSAIDTAFQSGESYVPPFTDYDLYADKLFANVEAIWVDYRVCVDETKFPAWFRNLLVYALAAKFAIPIAGSTTYHDKFHALAFGNPSDYGQGGLWAACRIENSRGRPSQTLFAGGDPLTRARHGGR